jgi:hypothetical protein
MQINCPTCNGGLIVPGAVAPIPAPPPVPATPQATLQRPAAGPGQSGCPSCGAALARGAVLCVNCGYNLSTGQRTVAGRPAAMGKPVAPQYGTPWYKTAYPYIGSIVVLLGILYFFGKNNPVIMLAFLVTALVYSLAIHIIVLVAAFQESVGTGFMALCIPFYAIYFVFKVHEGETLKILYGTAMLINLAIKFMDITLK